MNCYMHTKMHQAHTYSFTQNCLEHTQSIPYKIQSKQHIHKTSMTQNTHIQAQANLRKNTLKHTQEYKHSKIKYTQAHTHTRK